MPELPALKIRNLKLNDWALSKATLAELDAHLRRHNPMNIVEFGSGHSTVILARYASETGANVTTFEHDPKFLRQTHHLLGDLRGHVDLELAPLAGSPPMYGAGMPGLFDFALIDGPPQGKGGRAATFPALMDIDHGEYAEVWLDDGSRQQESLAAEEWMKTFAGWSFDFHGLPHGLLRFGKHIRPPLIDGTEVTITMLTGARPELFADTWNHLPRSLVQSADCIVVLVNGADVETLQFVEDHIVPLGLNLVKLTTTEIEPMGQAMGRFVDHVESPLWLHLEDDWRYVTTHDGWLNEARAVLADEPDVAQVRLRHSSESVLDYHQQTRKPLNWQPHQFGMVSESSHLTANPMLARTDRWASLWPCVGEKAMQRTAVSKGMHRVVQLHPGAFTHTGDSDSLRGKLGR
jgi:hypothetical protein